MKKVMGIMALSCLAAVLFTVGAQLITAIRAQMVFTARR